jgi:Zn-dependent peptidase ImmA (M78 family)
MEFRYYKPTQLEEWISKKYQEAGILYAADMDLDRIADIFGIEVHYYDGRSFADWRDGEYAFILLNGYLTPEQRREQFFHELCHPLRHAGCQGHLPDSFVELQEIQAAHFQLYAAIPAYMLEEYKDLAGRDTFVKILAEEFVLPPQFVLRRLEQINRRIWQERRDKDARFESKPAPISFEYAPETLRILEQLRRQLEVKKGAAV